MDNKVVIFITVSIVGILVYQLYENNIKNSKAEKLIKFGLS